MPVNQTKNNEKVVLVTGSAQRVGASIIKELHARGWQVIIHYRHSEQAALSLASTLNAPTVPLLSKPIYNNTHKFNNSPSKYYK